jgi:two-component system sensor histidine kinase DegS
MTTQQLETDRASISTPLRCPNCGEAIPSELVEDLADLAVQEECRLLERVLDAQEQDRQWLANQIHEGLAQRMIGALLRLQAVEHVQQGDTGRAADELRAVSKLLRDSIDEARAITRRLRPPALDEFGIVAGIHDLTAELTREEGLDIEFSHDAEPLRMPAPVETGVFRIAQELLANVARHSRTRKVRVGVARADGHVYLEVRDCGVGLDPTIVGEDCFDLQVVRERAKLLGGRTFVDSAPGKSTRVVVEIPLRDNFPL